MKKHPNDGGCWFCHTDDPELIFDCEFDTFVHIACIKKCLAEHEAKGEMAQGCECTVMTYLFEETE